jgi:peptidoglycan hydrolase-like protein with peptidoglycan-binding domain
MIVAPITDSYDDETANAVVQFQRDRGLEESGAVDQPTWLALFEAIDRAEATGAERVVFTFDRAVAAGGGDPFTIIERVALEGAPTPTSDSLAGDWLGRSGFWLELQDSTGLPIFRRILGQSPDPPPEVKGSAGDPMSQPGAPTGRSTITVIVPTIAATRRLCLFGNLNDSDAAALLLQNFEPWLQ